MSRSRPVVVVSPHGPVVVEPAAPAAPAATDFPENRQVILHNYRANLPLGDLSGLEQKLSAIVLGPGIRPKQSTARNIDTARKNLLRLLRDPAFTSTHGRLQGGSTCVYQRILRGVDLNLALADIDGLGVAPVTIDGPGLDRALRSTPLDFTHDITVEDTIEIDPQTGKPIRIPGGTFEVNGTLKAYNGPSIRSSERAALVNYSQLVGNGPERAFRLGLLRAECHKGQGDLTRAIEDYRLLLVGSGIDPVRRKFVALQAAANRIGLGDRAFRGSRSLTSAQRGEAHGHYDMATSILTAHRVAINNPERVLLDKVIRRRKSQLDSGLNVLGLRDSFVPVQTIEFLETRADDMVNRASNAVDRFEGYLAKANHLEDVAAELNHELEVAEDNLGIAKDRKTIAFANVDRADQQLRLIETQQEFLSTQTVFGGLESFFSTAASSPWGAIAGIGKTLADYNAGHAELEIQREIARLDQQMAEAEQAIAQLEVEIAQSRRDFVDGRLRATNGRDLNQDLYYRLAGVFRELAHSQIQNATLVVFLYERAVAAFLGDAGIHHVDFDYLDRDGGEFEAAGRLNAAVAAITNEFARPDMPKIDDFVDRIFLSQQFPLEFARLQQTGRTSFVISQYDIDKRRPGTWEARLIRTDVILRGLVPPTVTGELTHMGRFVVRDRAGTLRPPATRLLPTPEEVAEALARQARGETANAAVGGLLAFDLDPDTKNVDAEPPDAVTPTRRSFTRDLIEDYGPAGMWQLSLRGMDLRNLTDVELRFNMRSFETDVFELQPLVEELVAEFEQEQEAAVGDTLDRIAFVSLRDRFPDAIAGLAAGPVRLGLLASDFTGIANPRVKTVVALALDADGRGVPAVGLELAKPAASFTLARTTTERGFSEQLDGPLDYVPPDQRFDAVGDWQLRLVDASQAAALAELRLFFVCDFAR